MILRIPLQNCSHNRVYVRSKTAAVYAVVQELGLKTSV